MEMPNAECNTQPKNRLQNAGLLGFTERASRVFLYPCFVLYRYLLPLQQTRAQSRLLYLLICSTLNKITQF